MRNERKRGLGEYRAPLNTTHASYNQFDKAENGR